jgi:hypothetical protein
LGASHRVVLLMLGFWRDEEICALVFVLVSFFVFVSFFVHADRLSEHLNPEELVLLFEDPFSPLYVKTPDTFLPVSDSYRDFVYLFRRPSSVFA